MSDVNITNYDTVVSKAAGPKWITSEEFDLGGYTAADTFNVLTLHKGALVLGGYIEITEIAGEACTVDVGITGTDVDCFIDGADMNAAAGTLAGALLPGDYVTNGKSLGAASVVTVLAVTGTTYAAGKGKVHLLVA